MLVLYQFNFQYYIKKIIFFFLEGVFIYSWEDGLSGQILWDFYLFCYKDYIFFVYLYFYLVVYVLVNLSIKINNLKIKINNLFWMFGFFSLVVCILYKIMIK